MKKSFKFDDELNLSIGNAINEYISSINLSDIKFFNNDKKVKSELNFKSSDYTMPWLPTFGYHIREKNHKNFVDDVMFGFNFGGLLGENHLVFVTEGIYYLKKSSENRTNKKGNVIETTVYFPEFAYFTDLEFMIQPKKKFFGLGGDSEKNCVLKFSHGSNELEFKVKKESENFLNQLIETIEKSKTNYENKLHTGKESLVKTLEFNITDSKGFFEYLDTSESAIAEIDETTLKGFVKLANFLRTKESQIKRESEMLVSNAHEVRDLEIIEDHMNTQINLYNEMYVLSINMIVAFIEKKNIMYYKIYEVFDGVGVFNSSWQNGINGALANINTGIQELITQIDHLEISIISEISYLRQDIMVNLDDFEETVNNSLGSVATRINYGNLLSTVRMINGK